MKLKSFVFAALMSVMALPAFAEPLNIAMHQSSVLRLDGVAATVIVGNPMIADVSVIEGSLLVVQGRLFGSTDVIALDANGRELANLSVLVTDRWRGGLTLSTGNPGRGERAASTAYTCAPVCTRTLHPGDDSTLSSLLAEQTKVLQDITHRGMLLGEGD